MNLRHQNKAMGQGLEQPTAGTSESSDEAVGLRGEDAETRVMASPGGEVGLRGPQEGGLGLVLAKKKLQHDLCDLVQTGDLRWVEGTKNWEETGRYQGAVNNSCGFYYARERVAEVVREAAELGVGFEAVVVEKARRTGIYAAFKTIAMDGALGHLAVPLRYRHFDGDMRRDAINQMVDEMRPGFRDRAVDADGYKAVLWVDATAVEDPRYSTVAILDGSPGAEALVMSLEYRTCRDMLRDIAAESPRKAFWLLRSAQPGGGTDAFKLTPGLLLELSDIEEERQRLSPEPHALRANDAYRLLTSVVDQDPGLLKHYPGDLHRHDRGLLESLAPGETALWLPREMGTYFETLGPSATPGSVGIKLEQAVTGYSTEYHRVFALRMGEDGLDRFIELDDRTALDFAKAKAVDWDSLPDTIHEVGK